MSFVGVVQAAVATLAAVWGGWKLGWLYAAAAYAVVLFLASRINTLGIGISIGPPKVELGEWAVQGTCVVVHQLLPASSGGDQQPRANRAARIRHGQGHQPARAHPNSPRTHSCMFNSDLLPRVRHE